MNDFEQALRAHGIRPNGPVLPDGKIHKCKTDSHPHRRNGRYMYATDGEFGWYKDWAQDADVVIWRADGLAEGGTPRTIDTEAVRRRQREERRQRRLATMEAREFFEACKPLIGGHPYLAAKGLDMTGAHGLKVDAEGWLVVPAMRNGSLVSVQRIAPDSTKRFWTGAPMSAVSYMLERRGATITVLCEGLATGLAIFAAAPLARVLVCFTSGNLVKVAERQQWRGNVCVAADNDHETEQKIGKNPGIVAASEAAELIGCGVMMPRDLGPKESDWMDYRKAEISRRREIRGKKPWPSDGQIRQEVDGLIAIEVQRAATFVVPKP